MSLTNSGMNPGRHEMWVDSEKKVFHIGLFGFYGVEDAERFFVDYEKYTLPLDKKEYRIVINCLELSTFKPDILPYLQDAYKAYAAFKEVHFVNSPNVVGKSQLKRIAREVDLLDQFNFVDDVSQLPF